MKDLDRLLELHYGLEVWQNPELLNKSAEEYNSLKSELEFDLDVSKARLEVVEKLEQQVKELENSKKFYLNKYAETEGIIENLKINYETKIKELQEELNKINDIVGHVTIDEILQALKLMELVEENIREGRNLFFLANLLEEAKK